MAVSVLTGCGLAEGEGESGHAKGERERVGRPREGEKCGEGKEREGDYKHNAIILGMCIWKYLTTHMAVGQAKYFLTQMRAVSWRQLRKMASLPQPKGKEREHKHR